MNVVRMNADGVSQLRVDASVSSTPKKLPDKAAVLSDLSREAVRIRNGRSKCMYSFIYQKTLKTAVTLTGTFISHK